MNRIFQNTICFVQTLGVIATLLAMLFVSSAQGSCEECSEQTVSQEVELVLGRREERRLEKRSTVSNFQNAVLESRRRVQTVQNRFFAAGTEHAKMNGSGTYLLI